MQKLTSKFNQAVLLGENTICTHLRVVVVISVSVVSVGGVQMIATFLNCC